MSTLYIECDSYSFLLLSSFTFVLLAIISSPQVVCGLVGHMLCRIGPDQCPSTLGFQGYTITQTIHGHLLTQLGIMGIVVQQHLGTKSWRTLAWSDHEVQACSLEINPVGRKSGDKHVTGMGQRYLGVLNFLGLARDEGRFWSQVCLVDASSACPSISCCVWKVSLHPLWRGET